MTYVHKGSSQAVGSLFQSNLNNGNNGRFNVCESDVRRDKKDCFLHFNHTHLQDIRDCLCPEASE